MGKKRRSRQKSKKAELRSHAGLNDCNGRLKARLSFGNSKADRAKNMDIGRKIGQSRDEDSVKSLVALMQDQQCAGPSAAALAGCGEEAPSLLLPFADQFLTYLNSREDWLVKAAMESLGWVCKSAPEVLWTRRDELFSAFASGSAEVQNAAVRILASLASSSPSRRNHMSPMLVDILRQCGRKVLPEWSKILYPVLSGRAKAGVRKILEERLAELEGDKRAAVEELIK